MGVTTIKRIENHSLSTVQVLSRQDHTARGANRLIASGSSIEADMSIPWAPVQPDFDGHHLELQQFGHTRYWIWQAANADGDFIRFSTDGLWHDQGEKVHGYPGVASNIFEAWVGLLRNDAQAVGNIALGERALVVLDSHFEIVPIAPKLPFPVTTIKRIENQSSKRLTIFNKAKDSTSPTVAPFGGSADVNITIPWVVNPADFGTQRLELRYDGQTRYWIWQEYSDLDGDYVRFTTTEGWRPTAPRVKGTAATGATPADLILYGDRILLVTDSGFEVWPHPLLIDWLAGQLKPLIQPSRRVSENPITSPLPSVPKKSAVAFSIAGPASDAYRRPQLGARYLYNDSGKRYEFTINSAGTVIAMDPDGNPTPLTAGWSYTDSRIGRSVTPPPFDLIAASGGRLFAKAKDTDQFYIAMMDHMFLHASKGAAADAAEVPIPSTSFKLDPQFGTGASPSDLVASTKDLPKDSPMSERLVFFHRVLHHELMDMMVARMDPGILYQLDYRPPQNVIGIAIRDAVVKFGSPAIVSIGRLIGLDLLFLAGFLALFEAFKGFIREALRQNAELGCAPPKGMPTYQPVTYARQDGTRISPPVIKYDKVLDIGVSHVHWFQQYLYEGGGEIQPLLQSKFGQSVYRLFNGPVYDGDGFIDGTCTVYALVKHARTPERPHGFALLVQDEQWYFNQRWRMVDPDDKAGMMFALVTDLANPTYEWNPATYWCPFRNGHINDRSRLAAAAHVVLVTGSDPVSNVPRIYSINFSWGTIDRTWRYRKLPDGAEVSYFDETMIAAGDEFVAVDMKRVYPETIRLREDFTIHLKGADTVDGTTVAGRWYQRYLPVDNHHVPGRDELVPGRMPVRPYNHGWKFLPEHTFRLIDSFSHFGVYDVVDSRSQYYDVTPATAADAGLLDAGGPGPWIDDTRQLYVSQWKLRFDLQRPGFDPVEPPSLFNSDTRLRIVRRGARWIAVLWDKRDDDLVPFERLPMTVTLKNGARTVRVAIGPHHSVQQQPMVRNAYFWLEPDGTAGIVFTPVGGTIESVRENVWRVRIAALEAQQDPARPITRARVVPLLDITTEGFTPIGSGRYERRWMPKGAQISAFQSYCSELGAKSFATRIWFEDLVGHVSAPESIIWQRSPSVSTTAIPSSIPLGRPVEVKITARDSRTEQPLVGQVKVNDVVVANTGQRFTHTFTLTIPPGRRTGSKDGGPIELPEPVPPVVTVLVPGYSPAAIVGIDFFDYFSAATCVRQTVPSPMIAGRSYPVSITMRNDGTSTWTNGGTNPFRLGSQAPQDSSTWGFNRRELPGPVAPGAEVTFAFEIVAPAPGTHHFRWRMLEELVEWFGDLTPDIAVLVMAPPLPTLSLSVTPFPVPLNRIVSVVVRAVDSQTGALVAGRVNISNVEVGATNTPFTYSFRARRIGVPPRDIITTYPSGFVTAAGYEAATINFGFPEI